jgi:diadenosine tetraphosphate (Ap4A) HIT family hydrolase
LAYAMRDAFPVSPGHTLIITQRHVREPFDLSDEELLAVFRLARSARDQINQTFRPDGYNLGFNVGAAAGQTVGHLHLHVIPRYRGDVENPTGGIRGVLPGKGSY